MDKKAGYEFIQSTKYKNLEASPQEQGEPKPSLEIPLEKGAEIIDLPKGRDIGEGKVDLSGLVEKRESLRKYADVPLTLEELSFLLWGTQGVKSQTEKQLTKRTVPSAGSRHPFETYLLINNVVGLTPGLYRYLALDHKIARLPGRENINQTLTEACLKQQHVKNSAVTFVWVAVPQRTVWRYSQRGYRYIYLDAGHVCQNLYLLAESINCGVCAIAAFDDDLADQAMGLDGKDLFVIYLASLGRRK
ncbi:MAG: SagB/ThcOx family dehydrogenase [Pelolinea sp.]|nr:SagB/ThcOx family dehydrogenase [Pelolinea sp.]